jgi:hypothetical protein
MPRSKENILEKLKEQSRFLGSSLRAFYAGDFAESARIAAIIRVLVYESYSCKPLLTMARPNGLELPILTPPGERPGEDVLFSFTVSVRLGPTISPAVDLGSSHYALGSIGSWWNAPVFVFSSRLGTHLTYTRKQVVLILVHKEGGAHVDPNEDPDYVRLLTDLPLSFAGYGFPTETPDLAKFLTAQSGVEMLDSLKRNFFPNEDVPRKWEFGAAPPIARYVDQISLVGRMVAIPYAKNGRRVVSR